jgi:hypothetical protein
MKISWATSGTSASYVYKKAFPWYIRVSDKPDNKYEYLSLKHISKHFSNKLHYFFFFLDLSKQYA